MKQSFNKNVRVFLNFNLITILLVTSSLLLVGIKGMHCSQHQNYIMEIDCPDHPKADGA